MQTQDYRVRLDAFDGPLDLLLYLIRRAEVDIADIPIATIADQYADHLRGIDRVDIDTAGDFLVMAATLAEIKSRTLRPAPAGADDAAPPGETADPRDDLVRQLLAYKAFRDASGSLERRLEDWARRVPAAAGSPPTPRDEVDLTDLDVLDLARAFLAISEVVNFDRLGEHHVVFDDTPIELHAEDLLDQVRRSPGLTLRTIFAARSRAEMLGLFLALLELVRRRAIRLTPRAESDDAASIVLQPAPPDDAAPPDAGPPAPPVGAGDGGE